MEGSLPDPKRPNDAIEPDRIGTAQTTPDSSEQTAAPASKEADEQLLDAATAETTAIYSEAPINGPDWFLAKVQMAASFANRLAGTSNWTIGNGAGSMADKTVEEAAAENDEKSRDWMDAMIEIAEVKEERERRERDEWERTTHRMAGVELTGKEWGKIAEELKKGGEGRDWLINYLMKKKHMTREEADQAADDMQLAASGMSKPADQRTEPEQRAIERVEANPEAKEILKHYQEAQEQDFPPVSDSTKELTNTTQAVSVSAASSDLYEDFPSAPDLTEHHRAAVAATEPLDAQPTPQLAAISKPQPQPGGGAGLEV